MKIQKNWTTIIESMIVLMIIVIGIVWTYTIFDKSNKIALSADYKMQAIWIAREWLELVSNIRDTNLSLFAANTEECWLNPNYDTSCISKDDKSNIVGPWSYIIEPDIWSRFKLTDFSWTETDYDEEDYRDFFEIRLDSNGNYVQWEDVSYTDLKPLFTREIKISYIWENQTEIDDKQQAKIESIVRRIDSAKNEWNYEIKLETILTNFK